MVTIVISRTWKTTSQIRCDNESAIHLTQNSTYHSRSKHIDIRYHFIRKLVEEKKSVIEYLNTEEMVAVILTKSLAGPKHSHCRELMSIGAQSIYSSFSV